MRPDKTVFFDGLLEIAQTLHAPIRINTGKARKTVRVRLTNFVNPRIRNLEAAFLVDVPGAYRDQ